MQSSSRETPSVGTIRIHIDTIPILWMNIGMEYFVAPGLSIGPRLNFGYDIGFFKRGGYVLPSLHADYYIGNITKTSQLSLGVFIGRLFIKGLFFVSPILYGGRVLIHHKRLTWGLAIFPLTVYGIGGDRR